MDPHASHLFLFALLSESAALTDGGRHRLAAYFPYPDEDGTENLRRGMARSSAEAGLGPAKELLGPRWPSAGLVVRARERAQTWRERGVFCIAGSELKPSGNALPRFLFAWGKVSIYGRPLAAVLHSRKPRPIHPADRWVRVTRRLAEEALADGFMPAASLGRAAYEIVLALALNAGHPAAVVLDGPLPFMESETRLARFLERYGDLVPEERVLLLSPFSPGRLPPVKERQPLRDACLVALSDRAYAAEIRSGGIMEGLVREAHRRGQAVRVFRPAGLDRATSGNRALIEEGFPTVSLALPEVSPEAAPGRDRTGPAVRARASNLPGPESVIHFTRSCPGPWPGQTRLAYYRALLEERPDAAHTAFDTLCRILEEGRIRGSRHLVRGGAAVVSFTGRPAAELRSLLRWRPGLIRWTFEPYGVAVRKEALPDLGLAPVIYGPESVWRGLAEEDRYRYQSHRPPDLDWSIEEEWRLPGDLDLAALPREAVCVLVPSEREAAEIRDRFGYETAALPG
jgi:hypothetical protein